MSIGARVLRTATVVLALAALIASGLLAVPAASAAQPDSVDTRTFWDHIRGNLPAQRGGKPAAIEVEALRAFELDAAALGDALTTAPPERAAAAGHLELALPAPDGGFERFAVRSSPVMEPALAAKHPDITTYNGEGITDPAATIRLSLTPLGFHASVRGSQGPWYIDPYYAGDRSVHVSYFGRDLVNNQGPLDEPVEELKRLAGGVLPELHDHDEVDAQRSAGTQLRTYRLALVSDPGYAAYHGAANVTAAKVVLINRVTQIYEDESAIRLVLIGNNDALNLNTTAQATGPNGPCGAEACYTTTVLSDCTGALLDRNRIVIGQIIGASNFDIGHIVLSSGGGVARGGVGGFRKAMGCTGHGQPVGDAFAVDYVAHEMGHQFTASHTWSGTSGSCSAEQFASSAAVEPGSGSSIMGYAGICGDDDVQTNSDPYWSQHSFEQVDTYVTSTQPAIDEVQNVALRDFDTNGDSFRLTYGANTSAAIVRGTTYNAAGLQTALASILPAGATATITGFGGAATIGDAGFQVTFGGSLAGTNAQQLGIANPTGMSGFVGETDKGGPVDNQGWQITSTGNTPPAVSAPASYTIPYRTPFALTGSATDGNGDTLTYLWEQNDPAATRQALRNNFKTSGPLFRQFGTALDSTAYVGTNYNSAGENHPTTSPTRVFPDMAQILANNTSADNASCPNTAPGDCFSEFLPTAGYAGPMHFRLTARDNRAGGGGVNSADTTVNLAPGTGPFRVTAPNNGVTWTALRTETVTWDVAGTSAAPISTSQVDILMSTDGGQTYPHVLAGATANDGSETITVPDVETTQARLMIRAVGNIFFDLSNADFTVVRTADMELVSLSDSPDPSFAGETVTYTVVARNNGPSQAENARVVDVLAPGLTYESSSIPCSASGSNVTCGLGTLPDGESRTFTITASIARNLVYQHGAPVTAANTATADSDRDDPDPNNDDKVAQTLIKAKADLGVTDLSLVSRPNELIIGQTATVTTSTTMTNGGPSAPMDVRLDRDASATPNATVSPTSSSEVITALGYQEVRSDETSYEVACVAPGEATFTFTSRVSPDRPDDIDPEANNNQRQASFTIDCIVPVAVNIKPGSFRNPINLGSNGVTPLAVLTTAAGEYGLPLAFDARSIDATTVRFGPEAVVTAGGGAGESHRQGHLSDEVERSDERTRDGDTDMVLHFRTRDSQLTGSETQACVRGTFTGAGGARYRFHGCDLVTYVP